jgi:hypothetical protein
VLGVWLLLAQFVVNCNRELGDALAENAAHGVVTDSRGGCGIGRFAVHRERLGVVAFGATGKMTAGWLCRYLEKKNSFPKPRPVPGFVVLAAKDCGQCWACASTVSSICETNCCLALGSFEIASICFCHFGAGPRLPGERSDVPKRSSSDTDKTRATIGRLETWMRRLPTS